MQLSKKQKKFSEVFFRFLKSILNFKDLPNKMSLIADVFKEIQASKNMVREKCIKPFFRGVLHRQQGKWFETLEQSE